MRKLTSRGPNVLLHAGSEANRQLIHSISIPAFKKISDALCSATFKIDAGTGTSEKTKTMVSGFCARQTVTASKRQKTPRSKMRLCSPECITFPSHQWDQDQVGSQVPQRPAGHASIISR